MSRLFIRVSLLTTLLATAACTQRAAQIELRGSDYFGRNYAFASNSYSSYNSYKPSAGGPYQVAPVARNTSSRPISMTTEQRASVQTIGVSDLSPPTAAKTEPKPQQQQQQASLGTGGKINPWTGKPRETEAFNLQPAGKQQEKDQRGKEVKLIMPDEIKQDTVTQLNRVISNEGAQLKPVVKPKVESSSGFMWPVNGKKIVSSFGPKGGGKANDGINIAAANGEPVWAAADGEVVYAGNELEGYGNMVLIKHADDKSTSYAHLNRATVDKYDRVKQGDIIGYVGSTGNVKSPQLHFAIRDGKDPVDPRKYVKQDVAALR